MKRKLIIAGVLLGLGAVMVLAVLFGRQPPEPPGRGPFKFTADGQLVVQPREGSAPPTVVAEMPKPTNAVPAVR